MSLTRPPTIQILLILVVTTAVYLPSIFVPWYFDDYHSIADNPNVPSAAKPQQIIRGYIYRAIVYVTYAIDWHLSDNLGLYEASEEGTPVRRQEATVYHISSVIYHLLVVVGIYLLVRRLLVLLHNANETSESDKGKETTYVPFFTALAFGIHPVHTEAVTYLSGRASVLATLEYVWAILLLLIAAERFGFLDKSVKRRGPKDYCLGSAALLGMVFCFVLGIGTKEIIVTMPVVGALILGIIIAHRVSVRSAFLRVVPICVVFVGLLIGFFAYRYVALGDFIAVPDAKARPWWMNVLSQIGVIVFYYLPRQLLPISLCIDPQVPLVSSITHPRVIVGAFVLIGIIAAAFTSVRRAPLITIGLAWYLISLTPTSSVIPLKDLAAERRLYLSDIGFLMALMAFGREIYFRVARFDKNQAVAKTFLALFLCLGGFGIVGTVNRNVLYTDTVALWKKTTDQSPDKGRPLYNLANEYLVKGELQKAKEAYFAVISRSPRHVGALNNLGILLMKDFGKYEEAASMFERCIQADPDVPSVWTNLGTCYLLLKRFDEAENLALRWMEREPDNVKAELLMANVLQCRQQLEQAKALYLQIVQEHGEIPNALENLANIARARGDEEATEQYRSRFLAAQREQQQQSLQTHGKQETIRGRF